MQEVSGLKSARQLNTQHVFSKFDLPGMVPGVLFGTPVLHFKTVETEGNYSPEAKNHLSDTRETKRKLFLFLQRD